jgi:serine/threonine protein kinase
MADWDPRANAIFLSALDHADRVAYLQQACADDTELRRAVEDLLAAHQQAGSKFLNRPALEGALTTPSEPPDPAASEAAGTRIGPYTLIRPLGEGGMGSVWLAEQTEPVRRTVALKIIKPGLDSAQVLARFDHERQALALMDHPNIAKVLDAGATGQGRPYFVMELVEGVPLTTYCDQQRLSLRQRVALLIPICQAVQHAHQKGIIHRDLKPSNVLVTQYDGRAVPKVIDFGIAKAVQDQFAGLGTVTEQGQVIGTLEYMAPEQADAGNVDIDTRADIYSLGVLLYKLLTGSPPITARELRGIGFSAMLRLIREQEPPRPSARLSSLEGLPTVAAQRRLEPHRLTRAVRGDLDWIVMKCLEKDRTRRYETSAALALELERYLNDEPVLAGPPSVRYRVGKFVRRNKGPVVAAALVLLALLGGMAGTTLGMLQAEDERAVAEGERDAKERERARADQKANDARAAAAAERKAKLQAEDAAEQARRAKDVADERRRQAEAVASLLESVFYQLQPRTETQWQPDLKDRLLDNLQEAKNQLEREGLDPLTQARLQNALGGAYVGLGEAGKAIGLLQSALDKRKAKLGADHPATLRSMNDLATAYAEAGKLELALALHLETLEKMKVKLGADHPDTLNSMNNLAQAYQDAAQLELAMPLFVETLEKRKVKLGAEHPDTLTSMNNLALAFRAAGKLDLALPLYLETMEKLKANLGADHPYTLGSMNNLAEAYRAAGELDLAVRLHLETLEKRKAKLGADHPATLRSMNNLADAYRAVGKLELAVPLFVETLEKCKAKLGADHPNTLKCMNNLATAYFDARKLDLALPLFLETLEKMKAKLGTKHSDTQRTEKNLAGALNRASQQARGSLNNQKYAEAETLVLAWLAVQRPRLPPDDVLLAFHLNLLGNSQLPQKKYTDAEKALLESQAIWVKRQPNTVLRYDTDSCLGAALAGQKKYGEAEPLLVGSAKAFVAAAAQLPPETHPMVLAAVHRVIAVYEDWDRPKDADLWRQELALTLALQGLGLLQHRKYAEAEPILRHCLKLRAAEKPDHWTTCNTQSLLGEALLGQGKNAEAEPMLLAGYFGLHRRQDSIPEAVRQIRLQEAAGRIVRLYAERDRKAP